MRHCSCCWSYTSELIIFIRCIREHHILHNPKKINQSNTMALITGQKLDLAFTKAEKTAKVVGKKGSFASNKIPPTSRDSPRPNATVKPAAAETTTMAAASDQNPTTTGQKAKSRKSRKHWAWVATRGSKKGKSSLCLHHRGGADK